jgi:hypothetical protein
MKTKLIWLLGVLLTCQSLSAAPLLASLFATNASAGEQFGYSVAISGKTVVVGVPYESGRFGGINTAPSADHSAPAAGAAYVYVRTTTNWILQAFLKASIARAGDRFGAAVAINGDTVVVGAPGDAGNARGVNAVNTNTNATNSGAAYVFVRSGVTWSQQAYFKASNSDPMDLFGFSVSIDHNTILVGAPLEASSTPDVDGDQANNLAPFAGAVYAFVRSSLGKWSQQGYLKASMTEGFGASVSISGDVAAAGTTDGGTAHVLFRKDGRWIYQSQLQGTNKLSETFGASVAISGNTLVVGEPDEDGKGRAYVFVPLGEGWTLQAILADPYTWEGDDFGRSVAIFNDLVVVGDPDAGGNDEHIGAGQAYVFSRTGTNWGLQDFLTPLRASEDSPRSLFSSSIAISRDVIVGGAPGLPLLGASGRVFILGGRGLGCTLSILPTGSSYNLIFNDLPGSLHTLQSSSSVAGPWATRAQITTPASGMVSFYDSPTAAQTFYRLMDP